MNYTNITNTNKSKTSRFVPLNGSKIVVDQEITLPSLEHRLTSLAVIRNYFLDPNPNTLVRELQDGGIILIHTQVEYVYQTTSSGRKIIKLSQPYILHIPNTTIDGLVAEFGAEAVNQLLD